MGRKSKSVRIRKSKSGNGDIDMNEINKAFGQLLGGTAPDVDVVYPKYVNMMSHLDKISTILGSLEILLDSINDERVTVIKSFSESILSIERITDISEFVPEHYTEFKESPLIEDIIVMCSNMSSIGTHLKKSWDEVDKNFMYRYNGHTFEPLPFCKIDFKGLYIIKGDSNDQFKECVFSVLRGLFINSFEIYKISSSPNIDSSKLADLVIKSIAKLKKRIPGCNLAFDKIAESSSVFEGNFDGYYKDFVQTNNPANIFTSFISDVSSANKSTDISILFQCRKIVSHFRKAYASSGKTNSKMSSMNKMMEIYDKIDGIMTKNIKERDDRAEKNESENMTSLPEEEPIPEDTRDIDSLMDFIMDDKKFATN